MLDEQPRPNSRALARRQWLRAVGLGLAGASLAACGAPSAAPSPAPATPAAKPTSAPTTPPAAKPTTAAAPTVAAVDRTPVRLSSFVGTNTPIVLAMQKLGLFDKYGLTVQVQEATGPDGVHTALRTGAADVGHAGFHTVPLLYLQGTKIINVHGLLDFVSDVVVKTDSPIQTLGDLKGKRIGIFAGPAATATNLFRVGLIRYYGFDPMSDAKVNFGAPPVVSAMLSKDEVDAALFNDPIPTQLIESGGYRAIGQIANDFAKEFGARPILVSVGVREEFATQHPTVVTNYLRAVRDAFKALETNDELWQEVAPTLGLKTPEGAKLLQQRTQPSFVPRWDEQQIASQKRIGELMIEVVGKDFLPSWPDEAFTTRYNP